MNMYESLQNIGFEEKEAKIYVSLLQLGKANAYTLAKHSNIKRPTAYVILENLIDRGIVSKVPRSKTALYTALSPKDLFATAESKVLNAKEALPELEALSKGRKHKVQAVYYEGMEGIKEMYSKLMQEMKGKEYVAFYAHGKNTSPNLWEYFDKVTEQHKKLQIKRRGITVHDPKTLKKYLTKQHAKEFNVVLRALPQEKYNSNISIEIYKNYMQIFSHRYLQAVVIDNPDVARVMKQIFEMIWERDDFIKVKK